MKWKVSKIRRTHILLALPFVLLVYLIWHCSQPREYYLAKRIPLDASALAGYSPLDFIPASAGFLLREGYRLFVMRDWDGNERWRVTTEEPSFAGWPTLDRDKAYRDIMFDLAANTVFALSPNGRYFAAIIPQGHTAHLHIWDYGLHIGRHTLQIPEAFLLRKSRGTAGYHTYIQRIYQLHVLDDGTVYCWPISDTPEQAIVVAGQRLLATGMIPANSDISPDAGTLVTYLQHSFNYYRVTLAQGQLRLHVKYSSGVHVDWSWEEGRGMHPAILENGFVMADGGFLFGSSGRGPRLWTHKETIWDYHVHAGSPYFTASGPYDDKKTRARIICPKTGDAWSLPAGNVARAVTQDGSFALVESRRSHHNLMADTLHEFTPDKLFQPHEPTDFDELADGHYTTLTLFQRPGRQLARLDLHFAANVSVNPWGDYDDMDWLYPSPDGRALIALGVRGCTFDTARDSDSFEHRMLKDIHFDCLILKW